MNIFFCGSVLNFKGLQKYKGEPPASSQWIKGFLNGLISNNSKVTVISAIWDSLFPKGKLLPGHERYLDADLNQVLTKYINIAFLRNHFVENAVYRSIKNQISKGNIPDVIFTYNTYPYYVGALKRIKKEYPRIKWINIILDLDDPTKDNWAKFLSDTSQSDASVFLSWWGFTNAPIKNKFHLDCGWSGELPQVKYNNEKRFLHAGKNAKYGGIDELIEVIKHCKHKDVSFHFYGKDNYKALNELSEKDNRVILHGFVSNEELDIACKNATAFLSPRELNYQGTRMIFPSKILTYLKYQKPIVSAMLPGLSPEYEKVLIVPTDNNTKSWNEAIEKIVKFNASDFEYIVLESKNILIKKHWEYQTKELVEFLKHI